MNASHASTARTLGALILGLATAGVAGGQSDGDLDPSFSSDGLRQVDIQVGGQNRTNTATDVALDAEGRIVLAGTAKLLPGGSGEERLALVRLEPNGELDASFGNGGRAVIRPFSVDPDIYRFWGGRLEIAPDGDLYELAQSAIAGGPVGWVLVRVRPNGSLDPTFGDDGAISLFGISESPADLALTASGRILVLEDFIDEGAIPINVEWALCRHFDDGSVDPTFGDGGCAVVGFNLGGNWDDSAGAMLLQPDGRILLAGSAAVGGPSSTDVDFAVARLEPDGDLDPTFSGNGLAVVGFDFGGQTEDFAHALALDPSGRIVVAGFAGDEVAVARLRADGSIDGTFGTNGRTTFHFGAASPAIVDVGFGLAIQDDGKILIVGRGGPIGGGGMRFGVARLTTSGELDPTFWNDGTRLIDATTGTGTLSVARAAVLQPDGRLVVAGGAERSGADFDFVAARLHLALVFADGFESADTSRWTTLP